MSNINDPDRGYYDTYDPVKNYTRLVAIAERGAQAQEFNGLQSMILDFLKRLGDSIFKDGNIREGCQVSVVNKEVNISPGKIYLKGIVRDTKGGTVTITGVGDEFIGVRLESSVVTELEDESLYDPAVGSANHLHPGCHRIKDELVFTLNDDTSAPIVKLKDGQIVNLVEDKPAMDTMSEVLARRTFDESGNYVVKGFELNDAKHSDEDTILIGLSRGKAYIRGYETQRPSDTTFTIKKSKTYRTTLGEPKVVSTTTDTYSLINHPVRQINRVFATCERIETVNRGAVAGTIDNLLMTPVVKIVEVKQGGTVYVGGVDFLLNNNRIDWSPTGKEPDTGSNYTVKYQYKVALTENVDYKIISTDNKTVIKITSGALVENTELLIDYDYYLARKDTISLDKDGNVIVTEGTPNDLIHVTAPVITDESILKLGSVCAMPNSAEVIIVNNTVKVSTMERIQNTINRVNDLEYNMTITDLDDEVMKGEAPTEMKGIFTDGFLNYNKIDLTYPEVKLAIDPLAGTLLLPFKEFVTPITPGTNAENAFSKQGNVYSCPFRETLLLRQPFSTQSMKVNPYMVFTPTMSVTVDPMVDNWIDSSKITVNNVNTTTTQLSRWWLHAQEPWADKEKQKWEMMGFSGDPGSFSQVGGIVGNESNRWLGIYYNEHQTGVKEETILDEAIMYMRPTTVKIVSRTFPFNENDIRCKFDGRDVHLTPLNTTTSGSLPGSVCADGTGLVEASFVVPENVPCGTKEVTLYSPNFEGSTTYSASGRKIVTQETIFIERREVHAVDPLAQTFQLDDTYNLTSLDLYFAEKDGTIPAKVQIRATHNGYPTNIVYGEQTLTGAEIKTSSDGSVATKVTFPNVIKCEKDVQYAVVIMTDSPKMSLHVCKLGERDTVTGQYVTSNAYTAGVLFSSSNAITWSAHQDMDLKFTLYRAEYEPKGCLYFNTVTLSSIDRIMVALESVVPVNCKCILEVRLNGGAWLPFLPWLDRYLDMNVTTAEVRVRMESTGNQSPLISSQTASVISYKNELKSVYVSRTITLAETYNDVKVYIDTLKIPGVEYKVYIATDPLGETWEELTSPTNTPINEYWEERYYHKSISNAPKTYRVKLEMITPNSYTRPMIKRFRNLMKTV